MLKRSCFFVSSLLAASGAAQFQYASTAAVIQAYNTGSTYGGGVSFYDFNKDGKDDITFGMNADSILFYRNISGMNFQRMEIIPNEMDVKQPTWVDYDNDGDADFFFGRDGGSCKLYRNDGNMIFADVTADLNLPFEFARSFGCSWADYDRDGWLDVYVCNYDWQNGVENWLLHNNGDGTFNDVAPALGLTNDDLPTFQSIWFDWDFDGWPDLYVINDKNTGNSFYRNNGDGTFEDISDATNADIQIDSMSASLSDFDRDGDWDIYVTNTGSGNFFLRNDDGVFVNVAETLGIACYSVCWGALWMDHDNDMYDDLHVATAAANDGNQNYFFINNQDGTFQSGITELGLTNDDYMSFSSAKGDLENDGDWDFVVHNQSPNNASLWRNTTPQGKWLKLSLEGTASNKDAIGTLIEYWMEDQYLFTQTMCGENYISQDSQYEILAMGEFNVMDSLVLNWPSGWTDTFYNVASQQVFNVTEGETFMPDILQLNELCNGSTAVLDGGDFEEWMWSTGASTRYITISEPGNYSVEVKHESGISGLAQIVVELTAAPEALSQIISPLCAGEATGEISVSTTGAAITEIEWSNSETGNIMIDSLQVGSYSFTLTDENGCVLCDTLEVSEPDSLSVSFTSSNVTCFGGNDGSASISTSGGTGIISTSWLDGISPEELTAGIFVAMLEDENNCMLDIEIFITQPEEITAQLTFDVPCFGEDGMVEASATGGTGELSFDWNGINPEALPAGDYALTVTDESGCAIEHEFVMQENPEITAEILVLDANGGANGSALVTPAGGTPPYDYLWSNGSTFATVNGLAQGQYTVSITDNAGCSIVVEVSVIDVGVAHLNFSGITISPNPFYDELVMDFPESYAGEMAVLLNAMGEVVMTFTIIQEKMIVETKGLSTGMYILRAGNKNVLLICGG
ncbi:MAG: FG-GAP-like repeat-containing protein [Flavobacteriales bacterium]|nr:FG-GAP-like repeat-containing protein [Flavobacteriales bacterium]